MASIAANGAGADRALASLAVLNVNWHADARSYLDSFVPFVVQALHETGATRTTDQDACDAVKSVFALQIPVAVISAILRRVVKQGLASRVAGGEVVLNDRTDASGSHLRAEHAALLREQEDLERALVAFALERFALAWDQAIASRVLLAYIEDASARMIVANYRAATPADSYDSTEAERLTVAAFIQEIWSSQPQRFEYLLNAAKGSFLATTMFFQNHFDPYRRFKNTVLYLDTGVVLAAGGYEGPTRQAATLEWMRLAQSQGAQLAAFEGTVREARGVLQNAQSTIKAGYGWKGRPQSVTEFFYKNSMSLGVIATEISALENRLARLRIAVVGFPDPNVRRSLQVDEDVVEEALNVGPYPYLNKNALHHDSRVLAAMLFLRNRTSQDRFEDAKAVFVTANFRVVRAGRTVADFDREPWPVSMHVNDVAVLLWIKVGTDNSDLPKKQLLATCLSILRPSEATWEKYVHEIEALEKQGSAQDADVALIAQQNERDRTALIESIDKGGTIKLRTAADLLEKARSNLVVPVQAAMQAESDVRAEELEASLAKATTAAQLAQAELDAVRTARRDTLVGRAGALSLLIICTAIGVVTAVVIISGVLLKYDALIALGVIAFVLQIASAFFKFGTRSVFGRFKDRIAARLVVSDSLAAPRNDTA